jgi:putative peptide zinc metalloprotease protein
MAAHATRALVTELADAPVAIAQRVALLGGVAPIATLPDQALLDVAGRLGEERYEPGATVFAEGDPGDRLFIVAAGEGELSAAGSVGQVPLATLGPGEMLGELSLLSSAGKRNATLTALTALTVLTLPGSGFRELLANHPDTRTAFELYAEQLLTARFIKSVGPFMTLDDRSRRALAQHLTRQTVAAGETIIRQGEIGQSCYLVRAGRVDVLLETDSGEQRVVTSMGPGSVFGEAALLTDAPRSATVRASEPCEVLELQRSDLQTVLEQDRSFGREMVQLFRLQERPRRDAGVLLSERQTPEGETLTILKHPEHLTYYRLSERGRFIWERLDGDHDLRALTLELFREFREFAPQGIGSVIDGLARTKMVDTGTLTGSLGAPLLKPSRGQRVLTRARRTMTREASLHNLDGHITAAYDRGVRVLFTRPAQLLFAAIGITGLVAFVLVAGSAHKALSGPHKELLLIIFPATFVSIFLHEAAHAFTVKAFGRQVNRGGVGWYWFGPMAFVDTSDMWLGTRRQRILVSLAGPYADFIVAGAASIAALTVSNTIAAALLWSFALPSYIAVLSNLNPLLEFDGYHILTDLLDRPNLRAQAMAWLGTNFPAALRDRKRLRGHRVDLAYSLGSLLFIIASAALVVVLYRLTIRGVIASVLPATLASALAWLLALAVSVLAGLGVTAELRAIRAGARS